VAAMTQAATLEPRSIEEPTLRAEIKGTSHHNALAWLPVQANNSTNGRKDKMETNQNTYLVRVCGLRLRGAKAEAAAIAARRRSEFSALLQKTYRLDRDDTHRGQLYKLADSAAAKANAEIARLAEEFGVDLVFGPTMTISYGQWPECVQQWSEDDWQMALREIRRLERKAAALIERTSMDTLIRLMDEHLAPVEAKKLLEAIPAAAELVPELKCEDLKGEPVQAGDEGDAQDSEDWPF
jgi:hypothetical protein